MVLILSTMIDDVLYLYQVFVKVSHRVLELRTWTVGLTLGWSLKFTKGHNSVKDVGGVTELVLSTLCDNAIYLYQVLSKYLTGFQSYDPEQ